MTGDQLYVGGQAIYEGVILPKSATKEDLLKIIKEKERDIASLHAEIDKLEKYKSYQDTADEIKAFHTAFMNSGFSDEQAFKMVEMMIKPLTDIAAQTAFLGR